VPHRNRVVDGSRPRMGNLGRVKAVMSNRERTLWLCLSGQARVSKTFSNLIILLGVHSPQISIFTNNVFYFAEFQNGFWLRRLWNLLYRWCRNRREWRVMLNNIANFKWWRLSWFICWRPSGQRRMDSQIPEGGGCWQRTRTNSEWQTQRQYRSQRIVRMQRVAHVYYFRAFFDLTLKYTFVLTLKSVGFLELF